MKLYMVKSDGGLKRVLNASRLISAVSNNEHSRSLDVDGEWKEINLKWETIYSPDFDTGNLNVTIRVFPGCHWIGIDKLTKDGKTDLDIISEVEAESIAVDYPEFDTATFKIEHIKGEASSVVGEVKPKAPSEDEVRVDDGAVSDDPFEGFDQPVTHEFKGITPPSTTQNVKPSTPQVQRDNTPSVSSPSTYSRPNVDRSEVV